MNDILYLLVTLIFFAVSFALIEGLDRLREG